MRIDLEKQEIIKAFTCASVISRDPSDIGSWIRLYGNGNFRSWVGSDGSQLIMRKGELDNREYQLLLTPGQIAFMYAAAISDNNAYIEIEESGWINVVTNLGSMRAPQKYGTHNSDGFNVFDIEEGASGEFLVRDLSSFLHTQAIALGSKIENDPSISISLVEGHLGVELSTHFTGHSKATLTGRGVVGDVLLSVNVAQLVQLVDKFDPEGEVHFGFPRFQKDPLVIRNEDTIACLRPLSTTDALARVHVESVIEGQYGHLALKQDTDGDYWLRRHGQLIYGRLRVDAEPIAIEVFGVLLQDVQETPDLLKEINQINSTSNYIKIALVEDQVIVSDELVAESLDPVELRTSVSKIAKALEDYSQTLSVVYGGVKLEDPAELRWNRYRNTVVKAELFPEVISNLNGQEAVKDWPFPEKVHVVSGWNPQGVAFDGEYVNSQIAADVMQMGGKFVQGAGVSADGNYSEPSLICWGLDREQMQEIARKANQDAIFELTAGEISLISSYSDRVETFTRFSSVGDHAVPESP